MTGRVTDQKVSNGLEGGSGRKGPNRVGNGHGRLTKNVIGRDVRKPYWKTRFGVIYYSTMNADKFIIVGRI